MPTELTWYEPGRILLMRTDGDVALQDMKALFHQAADILDTLDHTVHFILDARELGKIPSTAINQLEASARLVRHRNTGWLGMVGMTAVSSFWLRLFSKILGLRYARFETVEEAAEFLRDLDRVNMSTDSE